MKIVEYMAAIVFITMVLMFILSWNKLALIVGFVFALMLMYAGVTSINEENETYREMQVIEPDAENNDPAAISIEEAVSKVKKND